MTELVPQEKLDGVRKMLEKRKQMLSQLVPRHIGIDRFMRVSVNCIVKNPALLKCDRMSFLVAIINLAELGLEPGTPLNHAHLVPFKGKVSVIIGYPGFVDLARRSGRISNVEARAVFEKDEFDYELGLTPVLKHKPFMENDSRGELTHTYVVATFPNGTKSFLVMSRREIETIKKRALANKLNIKDSPWTQHFEAMAVKCPIRRASKLWPMSAELAKAVELDEQVAHGEEQEIYTDVDMTDIDPEPKEPDKGSLSADDMKPGDPATHQGHGSSPVHRADDARSPGEDKKEEPDAPTGPKDDAERSAAARGADTGDKKSSPPSQSDGKLVERKKGRKTAGKPEPGQNSALATSGSSDVKIKTRAQEVHKYPRSKVITMMRDEYNRVFMNDGPAGHEWIEEMVEAGTIRNTDPEQCGKDEVAEATAILESMKTIAAKRENGTAVEADPPTEQASLDNGKAGF